MLDPGNLDHRSEFAAEGPASVGGLAADPFASISFLALLHPAGPWCLTAIPQDGGRTITRTFTPHERDRARQWIADQNGARCNVYYHVNRVRGRPSGKASAGEIEALIALHVDLDPRVGEDHLAERERIFGLLTERRPKGVPAPSHIIDSGGGFQALWVLTDALTIDEGVSADDAKLFNKALELALGADHCHNIDRLLRLPGTINWPSAKKRTAGREPRVASLVHSSPATNPITAFGKASTETAVAAHAPGGAPRLLGGTPGSQPVPESLAALDDLPASVPDWCRVFSGPGIGILRCV